MHWSEQNEIGLGAEYTLYNYYYFWKIIGTILGSARLTEIKPKLRYGLVRLSNIKGWDLIT